MALLEDVLRASGGLDLWRRLRRYTIHLSIAGPLCSRRAGAARLKELAVEGAAQQQYLEITGFAAPDRRALYGPDWIALEGADGRRLIERRASPAEFRSRLNATAWDELELAHYCGRLIWNYINVPFVLADTDFQTEELEPVMEHGDHWRRLRVEFPPRVATHAAVQVFYVDGHGCLRRLDYAAEFENHALVTQLFSEHQRFCGILVPTLCRMARAGPSSAPAAKSPLVDIEIFDASFE